MTHSQLDDRDLPRVPATRLRTALAMLATLPLALATACYDGLDGEGQDALEDEDTLDIEPLGDDGEGDPPPPTSATSCAPQMSVFPVSGTHNIGYDAKSCGSGTCETTCPDAHANSDWGGDHHGIDVFAHHRAELVAVADAVVVKVGVVSNTSGKRVRVRDACGWEYYYGHLDEYVVSPGQQVAAGQLIGYMGATGTGSTHLHFNVSPNGDYSHDINPFDLLNSTSPTACGGDVGGGGGGGGGTPQPPAPPPAGCGIMLPGDALHADEAVTSCDGRFSLVMQSDGNLVLYQANVGALWNTATAGTTPSAFVMQEDGNAVVYSAAGSALWNSGTYGQPGAYLTVQDDGNVVVYSGVIALWNSGTCCR